eukprot:bmy_11885T0
MISYSTSALNRWDRRREAAAAIAARSGRRAAPCRQEGKDRITLVTKEDRETPSNAELVADDPNDPYEEHRLILPNRDDINWSCPCLGGWPAAHVGNSSRRPSPASIAAQRMSRGRTV